MKHGIALAREKSIDVQATLLGQLLKAAAVELVRDEHLALFWWEFFERRLELLQQYTARVSGFWAGLRRREQIFQQDRVFIADASHRPVLERLGLFLTEEIDDPVPRYPVQPSANVFHRREQPVGRYEFVEDLLEDVLDLPFVGEALPDEGAETALLLLHDVGNALVLLDGPSLNAQHVLHYPYRRRRRLDIVSSAALRGLRAFVVERGITNADRKRGQTYTVVSQRGRRDE